MSIGDRICKLRKSKGFTQLDLANKLFITDKAISSWEQNRTEPSLEMLVKIAEILDCSIGYLVYGDNPRSDVETEIKIKITKDEYNDILKLAKDLNLNLDNIDKRGYPYHIIYG